jgi:hypothetical protein
VGEPKAKEEELIFELPDMQELVKWDVAEFFRPMIENEGFHVDTHTHKVTALARGADLDHPWVHVRQDKKRLCHVYRNLFTTKRIIHKKCLACWKIVVRPRTVVELFYLLEIQKRMSSRWNDCWCKCGIEERDHVHGLYGGYFYTNSKEAGLERLAQVRDWVGRYISPDVPIYLKRYCTEFEMMSGVSSHEYQRHPDAGRWEAIIDKVLDVTKSMQGQPTWLQEHVKRRWVQFAYKHGDETYMELTRGNSLYPDIHTYEE